MKRPEDGFSVILIKRATAVLPTLSYAIRCRPVNVVLHVRERVGIMRKKKHITLEKVGVGFNDEKMRLFYGLNALD